MYTSISKKYQTCHGNNKLLTLMKRPKLLSLEVDEKSAS